MRTRKWEFVAVPSHEACFTWRWRQADGSGPHRESGKSFELYFECVQDAWRNGYAGGMPRPTRTGAVGEPELVWDGPSALEANDLPPGDGASETGRRGKAPALRRRRAPVAGRGKRRRAG